MKKPYKNVFAIAILGSSLGYLAGLLTAKKSGANTRKDISDASKEIQKKAETTASNLYKELSGAIEQAEVKIDKGKLSVRNNLYRATTRANKVKSQANEILMAIKNGNADDKDLQKSVDSIKSAIKNLKNYLKN
ncbi:MAG TPA: YtxH domain-containing protein [Candidatus Dormibacteraeota bacterium]|nr:YtxH domain-containing protein [Candidatus Dormibacteraeota bacterium]